jgi:uncharacterized protein YndB with AHSA1/START domain
MTQKENANNAEGMEMVMTRIINAPRKLVWEAWTNQKHIKNWWGPKRFTNPVCEWDAQVGNKILVHMQAPDGTVYPMDGEFIEIKKPERLVFISAALNKEGKHMFEIMNTVVFTEENGKTKITINAKASKIMPEAKPHLDGMNEGWSSSIDKLEEYLRTV